jgi:uncharacterized protein (DUF433 family)
MICLEPNLSSSPEERRIDLVPSSAFSRLFSPMARRGIEADHKQTFTIAFVSACRSGNDDEHHDVVHQIITSNIDMLELPDDLERIDGTVRVSGCRVSLYLLLDGYLGGKSIDEIRDMYPTIPPNKLWNIMQYVVRHIEVMRNYHAELRAAEASIISAHQTSVPSQQEMRRRWKEKFGEEFGEMIYAPKNTDG